jgi:hypothetical protein
VFPVQEASPSGEFFSLSVCDLLLWHVYLPQTMTHIEFSPSTGTEDEWNEAYARLADYYRSYRLHNRIRRTQLILETLKLAAVAHAKDPSRKPTAHAVEQARDMLRTWFGEIYGGMMANQEMTEAAGRLGFHLCDGAETWSAHFLNTQDIPHEMAEAMRAAVQTSGPRMAVSKMTPRDIDLGLTNVAEDTFEGLGRNPWVRYAILITVAGLVLAYVSHLLNR